MSSFNGSYSISDKTGKISIYRHLMGTGQNCTKTKLQDWNLVERRQNCTKKL